MTRLSRQLPRTARNLVDVALLGAYLVFVPPQFEAVLARFGLVAEGLTQVVGTCVLYLGFFALAWGLVKFRGQSLAELGLRMPRGIRASTFAGLAVAAGFFALVELLKRAGWMSNDWGDLPQWRGNLPLLLAWIAMIAIFTGVVEEFIYRGFLMDRIARALGSGRAAWTAALVLQAICFGLAHAYGNLQLVLFAGAFGLAYGALYLWGERSLLAPIVAHISYDVARVVYFYWIATYGSQAIGP